MIKRIVMMEGGVETLSYFSHQMAGEFQKLGYAVFFYDLKQEESSAGKLRKFIRPRETVLVTFNFQGLEKEAGVYREYGLPESKIEKLTFENISFSYAENAKSGVAAMMLGCDEASKQGLVVNNVKQLILKNVKVTGCEGEPIVAGNVDELIQE